MCGICIGVVWPICAEYRIFVVEIMVSFHFLVFLLYFLRTKYHYFKPFSYKYLAIYWMWYTLFKNNINAIVVVVVQPKNHLFVYLCASKWIAFDYKYCFFIFVLLITIIITIRTWLITLMAHIICNKIIISSELNLMHTLKCMYLIVIATVNI